MAAGPWERSAIIPRDWNQRKYWLQTFELILTLLDMLVEQDGVANALQDEHTGFVEVDFKDTLRNHYQRSSTSIFSFPFYVDYIILRLFSPC
ncbi:unnamed protein product [Absidia cylindrospora]